jgi:predicted nucleotidyltransferase
MGFEKLYARWERERADRLTEAARRRDALVRKGFEVFERHRIMKAVLFGSAMRGTSRKSSDIDVLVMPLEQARYWVFRRELEEALGYPVDLYTQADDAVLVGKILERGEVIYDAEP